MLRVNENYSELRVNETHGVRKKCSSYAKIQPSQCPQNEIKIFKSGSRTAFALCDNSTYTEPNYAKFTLHHVNDPEFIDLSCLGIRFLHEIGDNSFRFNDQLPFRKEETSRGNNGLIWFRNPLRELIDSRRNRVRPSYC